jgi:hypothetical protein
MQLFKQIITSKERESFELKQTGVTKHFLMINIMFKKLTSNKKRNLVHNEESIAPNLINYEIKKDY